MKEHIFPTNSISLTSAGTAVNAALPNHPSGATLFPTMVRVSATGTGAYVRIGGGAVAAAATDTLVQPSDPVVMVCQGLDTVSAISVSGTSVVSVAALSNGCWDSGFTINSLFSAGEQGVWYDYSDFSTLFQDSAGTTPVTAVGQPVGKILDKSGRGNHATQATAINRPILQQDASGFYYLATNGTNSWMSTASIDFTGTDKMTVWSGFTQNTAAVSLVCELSVTAATNTGVFNFFSDVSAAGRPSFGIRGDSAGALDKRFTVGAALTAPYSRVFAGTLDIAGTTLDTEIPNFLFNGVTPAVTSAGTTAGAGNFGNYPLFIGARGGTSSFLNGSLYSLIVRGAASNATQISNAERYVGAKMGIAL